MSMKTYTVPYTSDIKVSKVVEVQAESLEEAINQVYDKCMETISTNELLETNIKIDMNNIEVMQEPKFK